MMIIVQLVVGAAAGTSAGLTGGTLVFNEPSSSLALISPIFAVTSAGTSASVSWYGA